MRTISEYVAMDELSDSAFILYLSSLLVDVIYEGNMPSSKDLSFIKKQFEKRNWQDYYERIFQNY